MKFFHLSDLHIGLRLLGRELREDQEAVFRQIIDYAGKEKPQAILIAGDIYDKSVPSAEAVEVFDHLIAGLREAAGDGVLMLISGNHDNPWRINCFRSVLSRQGIHMVGLPPRNPGEKIEKVTLTDEYGPVNFYLLPFVRPSMVRELVGLDENGGQFSYDETLRRLLAREEINPAERNVLVSHQFYVPSGVDAKDVPRTDSEIRTVGNIDEVSADLLAVFDYAALGHIHRPMTAGGERQRYCGTPLACSVSEAGQEKGVVMGILGPKEGDLAQLKLQVLPIRPLRQVKVVSGTLEEVLGQACPDYVSVELTGAWQDAGPDTQDRLRMAFPRLLEVRRSGERSADYRPASPGQARKDPFSLCLDFLSDTGREPDEDEQEILREVIHQIWEVN